MSCLTVVVPTVDGREHWLSRCTAALAAHTTNYELIVVPNMETCGIAWREGAQVATGNYVCFLADDIEVHHGWQQAAQTVCDNGSLPAPLILHTDGTVQSCGGTWEATETDGVATDFTRVPFLSRDQLGRVGPMIPTHEFSDNWVSFRGRQVGIETVVCHGYLLTHHLAPEGRRSRPEDSAAYQRYVRGELVA